MRKILIKIIPPFLYKAVRSTYVYLKGKQIRRIFRLMYKSDMLRYLKHSRTLSNDNQIKMIGAIILQYHVIEKGLTMANTRLGFGSERVISLCRDCTEYMQKYGQNDTQLNHAIGVIFEYEDFHRNENFTLSIEVEIAITQLRNIVSKRITNTSQIKTTKAEYFSSVDSSFQRFSDSRSSVRNFTEEDIPISKMLQSVELARNTPSACNRQSWRTYIFTNKQMIIRLLDAQGGNRGFGHLTNKLIVIAAELGVFCYTNERNQVFIDGGLYAMNLLYGLHSNEIAACILNCSFDYKYELEIKKIAGIKESEVLIAMVACGIPPDDFKIAVAPRYSISRTNTVIN